MNKNTIAAEIKYSTVYVCAACGKQQVGATVRFEVRCCSTAELKETLDEQPQKARDMPVGWANSYDSGFNCGCAKA